MGTFLTASDRRYFLIQMSKQINSAVHRRMNALLLLDDGLSFQEVAKVLYIDVSTVRTHARLYEQKGKAGVEELVYQGGACALSPSQKTELCQLLDKKVYLTAQSICRLVKERFDISYTAHAMAKYLGRIGFCYKRPKCVPAKANEAVQRAFLRDVLEPLLEQAKQGEPLYFVDATHPSHTAHPAFGWMRKGCSRELPSNHGRSNLTINGALSWPNHTLVYHEEKLATSDAMIRLFQTILDRHETGTVSILLDNARYNHSRAVKEWIQSQNGRIKLVFLPAYAPNLNLIERLWLFVKKKALWNKYYSTFEQFAEAIRHVINNLGFYKEELKSLLVPKFQITGNSTKRILSE